MLPNFSKNEKNLTSVLEFVSIKFELQNGMKIKKQTSWKRTNRKLVKVAVTLTLMEGNTYKKNPDKLLKGSKSFSQFIKVLIHS